VIVLELTEMADESSVGPRLLLSLLKRLKAREGRLVLSGLNNHVCEIFEMAAFPTLFEITSPLEEVRSCLVQYGLFSITASSRW
jgi:hypothetical protein